MEKNDLIDFFEQAASEMQQEYVRIKKDSKEDGGTAGDEGEENWANLLKRWLPKEYEIVTKGKIIFEDGSLSPQLDVLVLKSCYPVGLIERKVKKYLSRCVAAAFECKLTLKKEHFPKFFETARILKTKISDKGASPYKELHAPIIFGLLAHSSDVTASKKKLSHSIISSEIEKGDLTYIKHPIEMPDLICVADLANWSLLKNYIGPSIVPHWEKIAHIYGNQEHVFTSYIFQHVSSFEQMKGFTPIGGFISALTYKLSWANPNLRDLALYYCLGKIIANGKGINNRPWNPKEVYSTTVQSGIKQRKLVNGEHWHEWSIAFM